MSLFEYLTVAISIVLALSLVRLVDGLRIAGDRTTRYWVHLAFVLILLLGAAINFWNFWAFRDADWTLPKFLLALASPAAVFFIACSLVPENPSAVTSWRNHYYSARRSFFLGLTVWALAGAGVATFVAGLPWLHPLRIGQVVLLLVGTLGMFITSPRVHAALALGVVVTIAVTASTVYLQPISLPR